MDMRDDQIVLEQPLKLPIGMLEMVDPNRCVSKNTAKH